MTERLREELHRVGEAAAPLHVPGDLWMRGRRARRRDRVVSGVVALSVIGLIFAISIVGWSGLGRGNVAPVSPAGGEGAVPSMVHGVPLRLRGSSEEGHNWQPAVEEAGLSLGRASMAFTVGEVRPGPVIVTAQDGDYHLVDLPGWIGTGIAASPEGAALALSPDGRQIAWAWWDPQAPESGPMPAGVRIADLTTGVIRTIALSGRDGVIVSALTWSPDSRWVAWQGSQQTIWTENRTASGSKSAVAGLIAPGTERSTPVPLGRSSSSIAVSDSGEMLLVNDNGWRTWGKETVEQGFIRTTEDMTLPGEDVAGAVAPDGRAVALRSVRPVAAVSLLAPARGSQNRNESRTMVSRDLPIDDYPEGGIVEPLGWLDAGHVVALVTRAVGVSDSGWRNDQKKLVVMSAPWAGDQTFRSVTSFDEDYEKTGWVQDLTVAVDLMSLEHPTADFPPPDWPWSTERKLFLTSLAVAAVLCSAWLGRRWLRARRRTLR
jgi:hypothetical protein